MPTLEAIVTDWQPISAAGRTQKAKDFKRVPLKAQRKTPVLSLTPVEKK
jgi:hypothetical protein